MASSSNNTERLQRLPSLSLPPSDTIPAKISAVSGKVDYLTDLTDREQRNAMLQAHWNTCMSGAQKNHSIYTDVFVLLLSWDPACDDMAVASEVNSLGDLFEKTYRYKVSRLLIDSRQKIRPQAQVNLAIAQFVAEFDSPNSLFIIYYAGHGGKGNKHGELNLSGRRDKQNWEHIVWNDTEHNLKSTGSDILVIFDCCHASDLGRGGSLNPRSFEYLAASSVAYTRSPGPTSFTSALIWALKRLAAPDPDVASPPLQAAPMFTTSKLAAKICEAPLFPRDQKPSLRTRDTKSYQRIVLSPLPEIPSREDRSSTPNVEDDQDDIRPTECLRLELSFKEELDQATIKSLADHLTKFMKLYNPNLYRVRWRGISGIRSCNHLREAVHRVMSRRAYSDSKSDRLSPRIAFAASSDMLTPLSPADTFPPSPVERTPLTPTENMPLLPERHPDIQHTGHRKKGVISRSIAFVRRIIDAKKETAVKMGVAMAQENESRTRQRTRFASFWSKVSSKFQNLFSLRSR